MSAEDNKALSRRLFQEFWDQKNLAVADELLAANHVDHTPGSPPGLPHGPEGIKQFASFYFTAFPDIHLTIGDQVGEGDIVVTRWTAQGTNTGITIDRIAGGKIVDTWTNFDNLGMLQQLGVILSMG